MLSHTVPSVSLYLVPPCLNAGFPGRVVLSLEHHTVLPEFVTKVPGTNL